MLVRSLAVSAWLLLLCGCEPGETTPAPVRVATAETPPSRFPADFVEVAPAAREQLRKIAAEDGRAKWWLRIKFTQGGCTGMRTALDLDSDGPEAGDAECLCGDVRCVFAVGQEFLVQGSRVDWIENDKERGFSVTNTRRTAENQRKTAEWIDAALLKPAPPPLAVGDPAP